MIFGGEFLDILLQTRSHSTKVRIYLFEFRLVGYQLENNCDHWLEFGHHHTWRRNLPYREIPGSSFLEFNGSYISLLRKLGEGQTLHNFVLGQQQLVAAVNFLATTTNRQERAWSLIVVMLMICEAVSFTAVSHHFVVTFPCDLPLPVNLVYILYTKSGLSAEALGSTSYYTELPIGDVISYQSPPTLGRPVVEHFYQMPTKPPGKRQHLMEVFSVRINSINGGGKSSGNFFGTISVTDKFDIDHIYNRGREEEIEFIYFGDNLLLTGPISCIPVSLDDDTGFKFMVFGKKLPSMWKTQIDFPAMWRIQIDGDRCGCEYDEPISDEFATDDCSIMVSFIVVDNAAQATVEVIVRAAAPIRVYGKISARSAKFTEDYEFVLFQKRHKEYLQVCPSEHLKLSRSAVAVPWKSSLIIQVDLYDYDEEFYFVKGAAEFPAKLSDSSQMSLEILAVIL